jgi:hypothetical protein
MVRGSASRLNVGWVSPKRSVGQETTRSAERLVIVKKYIMGTTTVFAPLNITICTIFNMIRSAINNFDLKKMG